MNSEVRDNPDLQRYEILDGNEVGAFTEYRLHDGVADFVHTETVTGHQGRGLASKLVSEALDDARRRSWKVRPICSFVRAYIAQHAGYRDLVPENEQSRFGLDDT